MNKIDDAVQSILEFGKNFFKTFFNIVFKPFRFFDDIINDNSNFPRTNYLTYLLLAAFVFVMTINTKPLTELLITNSEIKFRLYNPGFQKIFNSMFTVSFDKLILIALPIVTFTYLIAKLLSLLFKDNDGNYKDMRKKFIEIVSYFNGTFFLYYFMVFLFVVVFSRIYNNYFELGREKGVAAVMWIFIFIFTLLIIVRLLLSVSRLMTVENKTRRRFNILILISTFGFLFLYYQIAKEQKNFDPMLNPSKPRKAEFSYIPSDNMSFLRMEKISGPESSLLKFDLIITNNSDELLILNPYKSDCVSLFIGDSTDISNPNADKINLIILSLYDLTLSDFKNYDYENKLIFKPGESQVLNLQCHLDSSNYKKLNYIYKNRDNSFYKYKFYTKLNFVASPEDFANQSEIKDFNIAGFYSSDSLFNSSRGFLDSLKLSNKRAGGG